MRVVAPHDLGLPVDDELGDVAVHRARYAPSRAETLAYRGGLLGTARGSRALLVGPLLASMAAATARIVRRWHPDVVHAHWWLPGGLVAVLGAAGRAPVVVTLHGSDVALASHRLAGRLGRLVTSRARFVAAVSEPLLDDARRALRLDPERSGVVRMPLDVPSLTLAGEPLAGPPWRVVAIGRLSPEKGFDVLLDALGHVDEVELELIGDGPEERALRERAARLARPERVRFVPPMSRLELLGRLARAHALVAPSRREGLGIVAVEALAAGVPVIASAVGGLTEVVGPGDGLLVPPDDPVALAEALGRLPLPRPATPAAPARHARDAVVAAHLAVYQRVTTGVPAAGS